MKSKLLVVLIGIMVLLAGCSSNKADENVVENNAGYTVEEKVNEHIVETPIEEPAEEVAEETSTTEIAKNKPAPDFTLKNLAGEDVSLSDYRGKFVLINFWATWCGFCDMEMPDLQMLDDENDDLVVLAVDVMEDKATVEKYINEGGYTFEVLLDEEGDIAKTYLVSGFPTSYFIDPDGILLGGVPGMMTYDQMNQIMDRIR